MDIVLTWEDSYAIARTLIEIHAEIPLDQISLSMIYRWTLALPNFVDDPLLANDAILTAIYQEWIEEAD